MKLKNIKDKKEFNITKTLKQSRFINREFFLDKESLRLVHKLLKNCEEFHNIYLRTFEYYPIKDTEKRSALEELHKTFYELHTHIKELPQIERVINVILPNFISVISHKVLKLSDKSKTNYKPERKIRIKMQDRHFISLLCYENFASLYYIPYIHFVFRIFGIETFKGISNTDWVDIFGIEKQASLNIEENQEGKLISLKQLLKIDSEKQPQQAPTNKPTMDAVLRSLCHYKNFSARNLVQNYLKKQIFTIFIATLGFSFGVAIFVLLIMHSNFQSFMCALPNICALCSLVRKTRILIIIAVTCLAYFAIIIMLCYQCKTFFNRVQTNNCSLFELLQDLPMDYLYKASVKDTENSNNYQDNEATHS